MTIIGPATTFQVRAHGRVSEPYTPATEHSPPLQPTCPPQSSPTSSACTCTPRSAGSPTHAATGPTTSPPGPKTRKTRRRGIVHSRNNTLPPVLMELQVGCRQPAEEYGPELIRYRLAGKLVKGQPLGGVHDEWVVIQDAYEAAGPAEQLHDDPLNGKLLFGRFHFNSRYQWFRDWVNGPDGQRLGLAPIPSGRLTLRMLRRKLAIGLAYRPGGLLAAKIYLHHVSTATTEGYASRPRGGPGRTAGRGQRPRTTTQSRTGAGRVPQLPAGHPADRARRPQPHRVLRQHRREARPGSSTGTEKPAQ
jgi:hypothetical protein